MYKGLALAVILALQNGGSVNALTTPSNLFLSSRFTATLTHDQKSSTSLSAGMGMAVKTKKKGGGGGKKKGSNKSATTTPFDAAASLLKMEKKHERLMARSARVLAKDGGDPVSDSDIAVSEYIVAARAARSSTAAADLAAVADWVPVAQLCVGRPLRDLERSEGASDGIVRAAVSCYCREISHAAVLGAPKFRDVPRQEMMYSVESTDSFHKHVYDHVNGKNADKEGSMTKAEARKVLKLEPDASDKAEIKQAYRKLTFALHPDRFVGVERTGDEVQAVEHEFAQVKLAFETLSSGVSGGKESWYESLGGKDRSDFVGPIELLSISEAKLILESTNQESVVVGLDPDIVQMFVLRNSNM